VGNAQINTGCPGGCRVVHADDPAIGTQTEIGLDAIGSLFPGQTECIQRVFGRFPRCAAMADDTGEIVRCSSQHNVEPRS